MHSERSRMIGKEIIDVEEEAMEYVFQQRPDEVAEKETCGRLGERGGGTREGKQDNERSQGVGGERWKWSGYIELSKRSQVEVPSDRKPDDRYDIPRRACEYLYYIH